MSQSSSNPPVAAIQELSDPPLYTKGMCTAPPCAKSIAAPISRDLQWLASCCGAVETMSARQVTSLPTRPQAREDHDDGDSKVAACRL